MEKGKIRDEIQKNLYLFPSYLASLIIVFLLFFFFFQVTL